MFLKIDMCIVELIKSIDLTKCLFFEKILIWWLDIINYEILLSHCQMFRLFKYNTVHFITIVIKNQ